MGRSVSAGVLGDGWGIPYEEALVSLDLATIYAKRGLHKDVALLVEKTWAGLKTQELHEEAAQALQLLVTAAQERQVALDLVQAAGEALRRHRFGIRSCPG
jgi:hypothetical protein